jgi:hypothetical protein
MLHVLLSSFVEDEDVVKHLNISSIKLMKVVGALVKPKGITSHSKRPSLDLKFVFHTSVDSMGTW